MTLTAVRSNPITAVAALLGAVPLAIHTWYALNGYFAHDDLAYLQSAADLGLSGEYLFQDYAGHLAPVGFALVWLVHAVAPLNFAVAMLPMLFMHAVTLIVLWRLLVRCFGLRWGLLVPFGLFACSPVILTPTLWWAYALQLVPLMMATVLALHAHVKYVETRRVIHLVGSVAWTAFGMLCYEKAALIVFLLFGVTILLARQDRLRDVLAWTLRRFRWAWVAHLTLLAAYVTAFLTMTSSQVLQRDAGAGSVLELAGRMVLDSLLVPSLGIPVDSAPAEGVAQLLAPHDLIRAAAVAVVAVIVIAGCVIGRRRAVLAWTMLVGYLAVDVALLALTRLTLAGPLIGRDLRYIADAVLILMLAAAFAFFTPVGSDAEAERREPPRNRRGLRIAVAAVSALAMVGATVTAIRAAPNMTHPTAKSWVTTLGHEVRTKPNVVLYDDPVPDAVVLGLLFDARRSSAVVGLLPGKKPLFDFPTENMHFIDDTGRILPVADVEPVAESPVGPVIDCGYPVTGQSVDIPLRSPVSGKNLVRISYYTADAGPVRITAGPAEIEFDLKEGPHVVYVPVLGPYQSVTVRRTTDAAAVCVEEIRVGQPVP